MRTLTILTLMMTQAAAMLTKTCVIVIYLVLYGGLLYPQSTFSASGSGAEIPCSSISGYDLDKEDLGSLSLSSNDYNSKPSASQASSTSMMATKRARVPVGVSKWQSFTSENKGKAVESTKGTEFTGFDRDGKAHQMIRPASTVDSDDDSDDDSDGTVADPREEARKAKEEVGVSIRYLMTKTDSST